MTESSTQTGLPAIHEAWLPREHALHRPRHGGRQFVALLCAAMFFASPLVFLGLGIRPSEIENRPLTPFPRVADGWGFWSNLGPWATDHLVFRDEAIRAADGLNREVFGEPPPLGGSKQPPGPITFDHPRETNNLAVPTVIEGKAGWMYLGADVLGKCKQAQALDVTLSQLRRLRDGVEASGRRFVVVVAPDKTTIVPEYLPDNYVGRDCTRTVTEELWRLLAAEDFVLDVRGELRTWGDQLGKPVYPSLDAHWADEGGIVMTRALAEALDPGISAGWVISPGQPWRVPADLPPLIGRSGDIDGRHYAIRPGGLQDLTRELPADFTRPLHVTTASGPGTIQEKVGVLGDSFSIRALRYLAAAFSDITILHYGKVDRDSGRSAGQMLAWNSVVAVEMVERTLAAGHNILLAPTVVDGIVSELAAHPIR